MVIKATLFVKIEAIIILVNAGVNVKAAHGSGIRYKVHGERSNRGESMKKAKAFALVTASPIFFCFQPDLV